MQLLHCNVKALPLGLKHCAKRSAANLATHDESGSALEVRSCTRSHLVSPVQASALLCSSCSSLDESNQLRLLAQHKQQLLT